MLRIIREANEIIRKGETGLNKPISQTIELAFGTSDGNDFMKVLKQNLDKNYDMDPDEKEEALIAVKEVLETVGMIPTIMYSMIEERNGRQMPLVISQIHDEEIEKMIPLLFKPTIAITNDLSPVRVKNNKSLVPISKQITQYDEEVEGNDDLSMIEEFLYNITGDNIYATEIVGKIKEAKDGLQSTSGRAVNKPTLHPNVMNIVQKMGRQALEFKEDVISKLILKAKNDGMLLPEFEEKIQTNRKIQQQLKQLSMESRRRDKKTLIISI